MKSDTVYLFGQWSLCLPVLQFDSIPIGFHRAAVVVGESEGRRFPRVPWVILLHLVLVVPWFRPRLTELGSRFIHIQRLQNILFEVIFLLHTHGSLNVVCHVATKSDERWC